MATSGFDGARWGAWMMAVAGATWGLLSYAYLKEAVLCGSVGVGFGMVAWSLGSTHPRRPHLFVAGFVLAAAASGYWTVQTVVAGHIPMQWSLFGVGVILAAVLAAGLVLRGWSVKVGLRVAFAIMLVAAVNLVIEDPTVTLYNAAIWLALLAAAVLVRYPPTARRVHSAAASG